MLSFTDEISKQMTALKEKFPQVKINEPLKNWCMYHIGGPADYFYHLKDINELPELIGTASKNSIPYFIIGAGSNLLFHDNGFRGLIIRNETSNITISETEIIADSGVLISQLLKSSAETNLTGLEPWASLPGTVGGAVRGNAGCNGLECKDILAEATIYSPETNKMTTVDASYFEFGYRDSRLKRTQEILLTATFKLSKSDTPDLEVEQKAKTHRTETQPAGFSAGSFFKNPTQKNSAGLLIDQAGLKGYTQGGAQISEKHANFIINKNSATAEDILALATLAKDEVQAKFNITLTPEVQILGETGPIPFSIAEKKAF